MVKNQDSRDCFIDMARAVGILLVVYAHALEIYFNGTINFSANMFRQWDFIYSFHMPLFFIISGYLYRKKSWADIISNSLFMVFLACSVHIAAWFLLVCKGHPETLWTLLDPILYLSDFYTQVVWFLAALAITQIIYKIIIENNYYIRDSIIIFTAIAFVSMEQSHKMWFQMQAIFPAIVFYAIGHQLSSKDLLYKSRHIACFLVPISIATTFLLSRLNNGCNLSPFDHCNNMSNHFGVMMINGEFGFLPLFFITAIIGSISILLFVRFSFLERFHIKSLLSWLGKRTLQLLILNGFALQFIQPFLKKHLDKPSPALTSWSIILIFVTIQILALPFFSKAIDPFLRLIRHISRASAELIVKACIPARVASADEAIAPSI